MQLTTQVDSAFYPPWDGKMSTSQRAVMFCGWECMVYLQVKLCDPCLSAFEALCVKCAIQIDVYFTYTLLYFSAIYTYHDEATGAEDGQCMNRKPNATSEQWVEQCAHARIRRQNREASMLPKC